MIDNDRLIRGRAIDAVTDAMDFAVLLRQREFESLRDAIAHAVYRDHPHIDGCVGCVGVKKALGAR